MKAALAVLSVAFFQLISIDFFWGGAIVGQVLYARPLLGIMSGAVMSAMAVPCFGTQTPFKRRLSLLGAAILFVSWFITLLAAPRYPGLTFFTDRAGKKPGKSLDSCFFGAPGYS